MGVVALGLVNESRARGGQAARVLRVRTAALQREAVLAEGVRGADDERPHVGAGSSQWMATVRLC